MNDVSVTRRDFMKKTGLAAAGASILSMAPRAEDRPNILWLTAEDLSPHLGCYGDPYAVTPTLDGLAAKGVRYNHAYATAPLCTPARSSIITGVFASSMGTQHLRGVMPLSPNIHCFTEFLRQAGYYCSNNVKEDYNFPTPDEAWDESSDTAHWRKRDSNQPFFSVFNFMTTHQSQTRYTQEELETKNEKLKPSERHDPADAPLPPYYPDTPAVRTNVAAFHTQVTLMDKQVKELLDQLEEDGLADDTIVFFYGDHGDGLPRGKRWLHDTGLRVPLIVYCPEKYQHLAPAKPGGSVQRLVSFVDFAQTVLSLAGIEAPSYMQGEAFLGKYEGQEREYVFGIRDRVDEVYEFSRSIRDERYHYIRNFMPHRARMQRSFYSERTPIRQELRRLHEEGELEGNEQWLMDESIPVEELYDTWNDPWELNNLADAKKHQTRKKRMQKRLYDWMLETKDLSLLPETYMIERADGRMPYDMARSLGTHELWNILEIADLVGKGPQHIDTFKKALGEREPAIRYWSAVGLGALGKKAEPAEKELEKALKDPMPSVRFAAAEAMCHIGGQDKALPVLKQGLLNEDPRHQLHASQILMVIGEKAKPAIPEMKKAIEILKDHPDIGWYTRENLQYMLQQFE
ncbi:sulfatase-like hydrolase/transferase [bacterium]|nr:sulfatase-like hydrolase/transferase [bacterium]